MAATDGIAAAISIKILLEPGLAGSIIGKGGAAVTGLTEISGAKIKVSNINDCYPGTADQVLLISGGEDEVDSAQELVWHRIAQHLAWKNLGSVGSDTWDPRATLDSIRRGEIIRGTSVTGRILIPVDACGAVIGTNGSHIKTMSDETGVKIHLSPKDNAVSQATQERIVTLVGEVEDCVQCTANILKKMQEDVSTGYENKTVSYVNYQSLCPMNPSTEHRPGRSPATHSLPAAGSVVSGAPRLPPGMNLVSAVTTMTLAVTDAQAGVIIGKKGSVITELQARSGASITVSARGSEESVDQAGRRTVVIVGSPDEAHSALRMMVQKLLISGDQGPLGDAAPLKPSSRRSPPKGSSNKSSFP